MDALTVSFNGRLDERVRALLTSGLERAADACASRVEIEVGSCPMQLSAKSRPGWWQMQNADGAVLICEEPTRRGWILEVKLSAMTLAALGPERCAQLATDIASSILAGGAGHWTSRVARLDLCTDLVGFDLRSVRPECWVGRGRAKTKKLTPNVDGQEFFTGGHPIAYYVGKGPLMMRVYDKTLELRNDTTGERRHAEHGRWRDAGWDGADEVTRVEFQLRGEALDTFDEGALRDLARFHMRLDALWAALTNEWVRLCRPDSASRRTRWLTSRVWRVVQGASFGDPTGEMAIRRRRRGAPAPEYAAGIALSYGAKTRALEPALSLVPDEPDDARKLSPGEATALAQLLLATALEDVADTMARNLVNRFGPHGAVMWLTERLKAARAKASTILDGPVQ